MFFWPRCHDQRRIGTSLAQNALFSAASSTLLVTSDRSTPTGTNNINFFNWLSWEGCGGKSVHERTKDGIWRCPTKIWTMLYLLSSGWFLSTKRVMRRAFQNSITSWRVKGSCDNQYISRHRNSIPIGRVNQKLTFGSHRWSHNQFSGCCEASAYWYNGGRRKLSPGGEHTLCWRSSDWGGGSMIVRFGEMVVAIPGKWRTTIALVRIFRVSYPPSSLT